MRIGLMIEGVDAKRHEAYSPPANGASARSMDPSGAGTPEGAGGSAMVRDSEFRTYPYITQVLRNLGWDTRNPARAGGQVYTQGEFRKHDQLLSETLGIRSPENIVRVRCGPSDVYWIIEAKAKHSDQDLALNEAKGYADTINREKPDSAKFATGIAGTPDESFFVKTCYWDGKSWQDVVINNYGTTGFLTQEQCCSIVERNNAKILEYSVDLETFLDKANQINDTLYKNGVAARGRARFVAGLLLALANDEAISISPAPRTLVSDINTRIKNLLESHGKQEFSREVELRLPSTTENHRKYREAIVQTMQVLREMNIRSAINSGTDALGQFYETFLRYANDAKEMGIVLTPRHITRFAVDVMNIGEDDRIFDPTCGTGGFLVSALDAMRSRHFENHPDVYTAFRNDCLYGVEQDDEIYGLVLVNMIFRGDGKSHIHNGNCFDNQFVLADGDVHRRRGAADDFLNHQRPFTRVLMNPPFAIKTEKESQFVDYALAQMRPGGLLFAVLPNEPITGQQDMDWRKGIISRHTVRAVIRLPDHLFIPVAKKGTYGLILEAHRPHRADDETFFGVLFDDEHAPKSQKSKLKGPSTNKDNLKALTDSLRRFIVAGPNGTPSIPKETTISKIDMGSAYDFASERYLSADASEAADLRSSVRELLFTVENMNYDRIPDSNSSLVATTKEFRIDDLFVCERGKLPSLKRLSPGEIPVITTQSDRNGIAGYFDVDAEKIKHSCITIALNGSSGHAFYHPYPFGAVGDVMVCQFRDEFRDDVEFALYVCSQITANSWRYDYYRKATQERLQLEVRIRLPWKDGAVDYETIQAELDRTTGFAQLAEELKKLRERSD